MSYIGSSIDADQTFDLSAVLCQMEMSPDLLVYHFILTNHLQCLLGDILKLLKDCTLFNMFRVNNDFSSTKGTLLWHKGAGYKENQFSGGVLRSAYHTFL